MKESISRLIIFELTGCAHSRRKDASYTLQCGYWVRRSALTVLKRDGPGFGYFKAGVEVNQAITIDYYLGHEETKSYVHAQ